MKKLLYILMLLPSLGLSQVYIKIAGKVVDQESALPLSFATVNIKKQALGVISNEAGLFEFSFPGKYKKDSVIVSMVGYESVVLSMASLVNRNDILIRMKVKPIMLAEIVITPGEEPTASEIITKVRKNIDKHYPQSPYELTAFYRDYKVEDGACVGLLEAAVTIYDKGYKRVASPYYMQERVKLNQVRKSLKNEFKSHLLANFNIMKGFLSLNDIRYRHRWLRKRYQDDFEYEIVEYTTIGDRLMYNIRAVDQDWIFQVYVDVETYLVPKIEMNYLLEVGRYENKWTINDSIQVVQQWAKETLEFQEVSGKWLPKFHVFQTENVTYDLETNEQLARTEIRQEFLVNSVDLDPAVKIGKKEGMKEFEPLRLQIPEYDPEFWENYNTIKLLPRDEQLIEALENKMALEEQFSKSDL